LVLNGTVAAGVFAVEHYVKTNVGALLRGTDVDRFQGDGTVDVVVVIRRLQLNGTSCSGVNSGELLKRVSIWAKRQSVWGGDVNNICRGVNQPTDVGG
jgi:hypothetical protein